MNVSLNSLTGMPTTNFGWSDQLSSNPVVLGFLVAVIVLYYVLFASLGGAGSAPITVPESGSGGGLGALEVLMWGLFVVLILMNGVRYFFNVDIVASAKQLLSDEPQIDLKVIRHKGANTGSDVPKPSSVPDPTGASQVYHLSDNKYTYGDAKAICTALDGDLATYDQIESAYKDGAEWCGYGWSDGQMAYFPTQKATFEKLQTIDGHKNDCGRPGINGGYIGNPNVRFGVNCYGPKPQQTTEEKQLMQNTTVYPQTQADIEQDKLVDYWKNKLNNVLVAPFNHDNWSRI